MVWKQENTQGNEQSKIMWELPQYTRGVGLDLGCGPSKAFPHFIGVDNGHHEKFGYIIKADVVSSCEKLPIFASQSMDFVFSSHLLEHIQDYKAALKEWWRVIKPGGHLVLYLPHKMFYPNIGQPGANPSHLHDYMPQDIIDAMEEIKGSGWDLVENQDRNGGDEYSFFQVYRKAHNMLHRHSWKIPKPTKTCAVVRYGAFGDMIQASSVIAGLKQQGYHITLYTSYPGVECVLHDPNIDKFYIQDKDQVPNHALAPFWANEKNKYDKWVQLSESLEGALLALPGRANAEWPDKLRRKMLNRNYLEFQHEIAEVPNIPQVKFYATPEEKEWAKKEARKYGDGNGYIIMYSLAGSSVHKTWAGMDNLIAAILVCYPTAHICLVGGPGTDILQSGWENEGRVHKQAGKWTIRQSFAFLDQCDLVIGPETGVLNAASHMPMNKIVFLSHSSVYNLTRDWVNTESLVTDVEKVPCYPCNLMHYDWSRCHKDEESGTALCQVNISVEKAWWAVERAMDQITGKQLVYNRGAA